MQRQLEVTITPSICSHLKQAGTTTSNETANNLSRSHTIHTILQRMGPTRARRRPKQQRRRTPSPERGRRTHNNINEHEHDPNNPHPTRAVPKNPFPPLLLQPLAVGERLDYARPILVRWDRMIASPTVKTKVQMQVWDDSESQQLRTRTRSTT